MKKTTVITLVLLVLFAFVSCKSESDGIFRAVVNSSEKSDYVCKAYLGEDSNNYHYVYTAKGILSFKLNDNHKAINISTVNTGNFTPVRGAYLAGDIIYGLDVNGNLFKIEDKQITKLEGVYRMLSKNGYAQKIEKDDKGNVTAKSIVKVTDLNTVVTSANVQKIYSCGENDYFMTANGMLDSSENPISYDGSTTFNPSAVLCIVGNYAVVYAHDAFEIHAFDGSSIDGTSLGKLSSIPTAAFQKGDFIYFKTLVAFDVYDTVQETVTANKKDGWARGIYTPTTEIAEFAEIDGDIYAINTSGGIIRIDVEHGTNESIF